MNTNFVEAPAGRQRRRYSVEFKVEAIKACKPGISMAAVALANGLNANMLRKWVNEARVPTESLLPVIFSLTSHCRHRRRRASRHCGRPTQHLGQTCCQAFIWTCSVLT